MYFAPDQLPDNGLHERQQFLLDAMIQILERPGECIEHPFDSRDACAEFTGTGFNAGSPAFFKTLLPGPLLQGVLVSFAIAPQAGSSARS